MAKIENLFKKAVDMLKRVKNASKNDKQLRNYDKLSEKMQKEIDDYNRKKGGYQFIANDKNAVATNKAVKGSMSQSSGSFAEKDPDIPIMKAYDQSDFINKREDNIHKLNK